jgi:alpha-2-macroglobulin
VELPLPPTHTPGTVEVVLSQTPLSELKDSIQYLMQYPNGCIEQTTSTAYPLVVLKDLLPAIGVQVDVAKLKALSEAGVARILSFQTKEGGLSYWPGGTKPHAFATAFGLTALIEAKKKGYDVPDEALRGMGDYLEATLQSGQITGEMPHGGIPDGDTRALFVMTLVRLGRPQPAMIATLWQAKDKLTPFGMAFLAIAVKESKGDQSLLQPILAEIRKAATVKTDEAFFDGAPKGGWSLDSPVRTDAGSLVAYAVSSTDPAMAQKLLKGLLNRRQRGLWGNTQENVFGIMGVYQLVSGSSTGAAQQSGSGVSVTINGKRYPASGFEKNSMGVLRLSLPESAVGSGIEKISVQVTGPSSAPSYVTVRATYEVPLDQVLLGESHGFRYTRSYETLDGRTLEGRAVPLGALVRVRLKVRNDIDRHYVAVDDLLPGGFEPQNAALSTTASVDMGPLSDKVLKTQGVISYSEIRDHRVAFYADELLAGDYEFIYLARATTGGTFFRPMGRAEAMYAPKEFGTTGGGTVTIK